jgi:hypothetical protein
MMRRQNGILSKVSPSRRASRGTYRKRDFSGPSEDLPEIFNHDDGTGFLVLNKEESSTVRRGRKIG